MVYSLYSAQGLGRIVEGLRAFSSFGGLGFEGRSHNSIMKDRMRRMESFSKRRAPEFQQPPQERDLKPQSPKTQNPKHEVLACGPFEL